MERKKISLSRWILNEYPLLHKIGKIYVDIVTKEVTVEIIRKNISILSAQCLSPDSSSSSCRTYQMPDEEFDEVNSIINKTLQHTCKEI